MSWYRASFGVDLAATDAIASIREEFAAAFRAAGGPRTGALFQKVREDGKIDLFFTPESAAFAADVIERSGATPCAPPPPAGLQLLIGHNEITYYLTS